MFARICVGAPLKPTAAQKLMDDFYASMGLPPSPEPDAVFDHLRLDVPKHKLHEPDRVRFERALEEFVDKRWDVDFGIGGVAEDGLVNLSRGFIFVGVRVEQFEMTVAEVPRKGATPEKPQWLRKGDLSPGSELAHALGPDVRKPFEHACRAYSRAAKEILKDANARVKNLQVLETHVPDFALVRWLVGAEHPSVQHRHGRKA